MKCLENDKVNWKGSGDVMGELRDLWLFMKERKVYWLAPVIILLLLVGVVIVFGGGSAIAPFIYTVF